MARLEATLARHDGCDAVRHVGNLFHRVSSQIGRWPVPGFAFPAFGQWARRTRVAAPGGRRWGRRHSATLATLICVALFPWRVGQAAGATAPRLITGRWSPATACRCTSSARETSAVRALLFLHGAYQSYLSWLGQLEGSGAGPSVPPGRAGRPGPRHLGQALECGSLFRLAPLGVGRAYRDRFAGAARRRAGGLVVRYLRHLGLCRRIWHRQPVGHRARWRYRWTRRKPGRVGTRGAGRPAGFPAPGTRVRGADDGGAGRAGGDAEHHRSVPDDTAYVRRAMAGTRLDYAGLAPRIDVPVHYIGGAVRTRVTPATLADLRPAESLLECRVSRCRAFTVPRAATTLRHRSRPLCHGGDPGRRVADPDPRVAAARRLVERYRAAMAGGDSGPRSRCTPRTW